MRVRIIIINEHHDFKPIILILCFYSPNYLEHVYFYMLNELNDNNPRIDPKEKSYNCIIVLCLCMFLLNKRKRIHSNNQTRFRLMVRLFPVTGALTGDGVCDLLLR